MFNRWARGSADIDTHFGSNDITKRRFSQSRRTIKQDVINCLIATTCRFQQYTQVLFNFLLSNIFSQTSGTQTPLSSLFLFAHMCRNEALLHSKLPMKLV